MFNFDPNDPRQAGLLTMALSLMGSKGNLGQAIGQSGLMGLQAHQGAHESKQQRDMRQAQLDEMRQARADREGMRGAFQKAFAPAQTTQPDPYEFDQMGEGSPQPQPFTRPGGGGAPEFMRLAGPYMDPMEAVKFKQQLANADKPEYMPVAPGASVFDKKSGKSVFTAPEKIPDWLDPRYIQAQSQIRAAGRPQVSVNTNMPPLEKKEQGDKGALNVKNFGDLQTAAGVARKENALLSGLEKIDLDTGKLTPANATVSAWVRALGGGQRFAEVAAKGESFTAFAKDLVLQRQLAQKGPQTESDARRLEQTVAQLGNTKEANSLIVSFNKAQNDRTIAQEKFYNDWWKKHKTYEGADDAWLNGEGAKSLWDDPKLKKFQRANVIDFNQLPP